MLEATESTRAPVPSSAIATWPPSGVSTQKSRANRSLRSAAQSRQRRRPGSSPNASSSAAPRTAAS